MKETESRPRRRGVRASRAKLVRALADAGLKTQAALADRMADLEGLEASPKDVVNRVFREQPVDPATLERIARALQTDAYKLYLTADEAADPAAPRAEATESSQEPATTDSPSRERRWRLALAIGISLIVVLGALLWLARRPDSTAGPTAQPVLQPKFGRFHVAIAQFAGDDSGEFAVLVRERLEKSLGVTSAALPLIAHGDDRGEIARRFRVDAVLDGEIVRVGEWIGLRAFVYIDSRGRREQIWGESFAVSNAQHRLPRSADHVNAAVQRLFGLPAGEARNPPHFPLAPVQDEYLRGRLYLDRSPSEINLRRAQGNFESALRHDANYAAAHAGLCEVALDAVWIDNEQRQLADAEKSCVRALQLDPQAPETLRAHAYFLVRSGRADDAVAILKPLVADRSADMESWLSLANADFERFRRSGEADFGKAALDSAKRATQLAPEFWKPWMWLGVYTASAGTRDDAIAAFETAYRLDERNEYVVTNLGTMYFCRGDFDAARDLYLKAREVAPSSYAGTEFLGLIYYYLRDFAESARLRQAAIDMARGGGTAEIHQMWGALADSYRQSGARGDAIAAYVRALEIVERDFLMGNGTAGDKASRAYYYLTLLQLDPQNSPRAAIAALDRDLDDAFVADIEPAALLRVTQSRLLQGNLAKAREALEKATRRCPCYRDYPDLAPLFAAR
jgi:Flp pilus assembly protein TadD